MQIHELKTFTGTPGPADYLAIDTGQETCKIAAESIAELSNVLIVSVPSFNSLPKTVTNAAITSDMVVLKAELGTPSAQTSDWEVTTSTGSLGITGTISGSTTLKLYLAGSR